MIQLELLPRDIIEERLYKVEKEIDNVRRGIFARHTDHAIILKDHESILMEIINRIRNLEENK